MKRALPWPRPGGMVCREDLEPAAAVQVPAACPACTARRSVRPDHVHPVTGAVLLCQCTRCAAVVELTPRGFRLVAYAAVVFPRGTGNKPATGL